MGGGGSGKWFQIAATERVGFAPGKPTWGLLRGINAVQKEDEPSNALHDKL